MRSAGQCRYHDGRGGRGGLAARAAAIGAAALVALAGAATAAGAQTLSVYPDGQAVGQPTNSTVQTAAFGVVGLVSGQGYFREIYCTGEAINCGSATPQGFTATQSNMTINVTYFTTNIGGPGRILL